MHLPPSLAPSVADNRIRAGLEPDVGVRRSDTLILNAGGAAATVSSYVELEVRLGWRLTDSPELSLVGQNLLDEPRLEYGAPEPGRAEIERSIHGKVAWRF